MRATDRTPPKAKAGSAAAKPSGRGRPTAYRPEMAERAKLLCQEAGLSEVRLAKALGISRDTLRAWRAKHPKFAEALQAGRDGFDATRVERALMRRALGGRTAETVKVTGHDGLKGEYVEERTTRRTVPPDTAACKYFLNNRAAGRWADKPAGDSGGGEALTFTMHLHAPEPRPEAANG